MPEMVADTHKYTMQKDHRFRASLRYVVTLSKKTKGWEVCIAQRETSLPKLCKSLGVIVNIRGGGKQFFSYRYLLICKGITSQHTHHK